VHAQFPQHWKNGGERRKKKVPIGSRKSPEKEEAL
jgi:hypothetical protein